MIKKNLVHQIDPRVRPAGEGPVDESGLTLTMLLSNTGEMIYIPLDPL
jgi:hypothetical protein